MNKLPLQFNLDASASGDFTIPWSVSSNQYQAICAIPNEFGGEGGAFSPEDIFLQALISCFIGTFKVYAKASKINFTSLTVQGQLSVDQDSTRKVTMKSAFFNIKV